MNDKEHMKDLERIAKEEEMELKVTEMTWDAIVDWFGKDLSKKMAKTGYLDGVTVRKDKDGKVWIPRSDIDRAYRAAEGEDIGGEWD
jgi:hypothetical protein